MRYLCAAILATGAAAAAANAQLIVLEDANSSTQFQITGGNQVGWQVDGVNQLFNQRFFYRAAGFADEVAVDSLPLTGAQATDTNLFDDPRPDNLAVRYTDAPNSLRFDVNYTLRGSSVGSGASDLAETIRIGNFGNVPQQVSFFQYVDFDLGGTPGGDIGQIIGGRIAQQADLAGSFSVTETVVTPAPSHYQLDLYPNLIGEFFNGQVDNLNDFAGPLQGDVTWGFQWDFTLLPGQTFIISKDKNLGVVPVPAGAALLGLTGLVVAGRRRR